MAKSRSHVCVNRKFCTGLCCGFHPHSGNTGKTNNTRQIHMYTMKNGSPSVVVLKGADGKGAKGKAHLLCPITNSILVELGTNSDRGL